MVQLPANIIHEICNEGHSTSLWELNPLMVTHNLEASHRYHIVGRALSWRWTLNPTYSNTSSLYFLSTAFIGLVTLSITMHFDWVSYYCTLLLNDSSPYIWWLQWITFNRLLDCNCSYNAMVLPYWASRLPAWSLTDSIGRQLYIIIICWCEGWKLCAFYQSLKRQWCSWSTITR